MKTIISFILILTVLMSSVAVCAAEPDKEQQDLLKEYGIMVGDPSGDMRYEDTITRAEVVKMIITSLNYVNAANQVVEKSKFPDVWETHWAKLYINTAKELGIVAGDENGNFNPESNIKNEEVVKMLVVALGYGPKAEAMGGYPGGYMAVASTIGLPKGLVFETTANANRGEVAVLFANALEIPLMVQVGWGSPKDVEYKIFDGKNGTPKATILTEYWDTTE